MTKPISAPVVPAQPAKTYYGIQELALFENFTRDTYRAAFGQEAPAFDPARPIQTWFDSTADVSHTGNVSVYKVISRDPDGAWAVRQMVIPAVEAASVNLQGDVRYPAYVVAPTAATRGGSSINPSYLSLESDAHTLAAEVGADGIVEEVLQMFPASYPVTEPRRVWNLTYKGRFVNVGLLLLAKNAKGIGYPGHWDLSGEEPAWVADPAAPNGLDDQRPAREMPVRDLLPNEAIQTGLTGVGILRTDLQIDSGIANGQFTAADRSMLQAIYNVVVNLK